MNSYADLQLYGEMAILKYIADKCARMGFVIRCTVAGYDSLRRHFTAVRMEVCIDNAWQEITKENFQQVDDAVSLRYKESIK